MPFHMISLIENMIERKSRQIDLIELDRRRAVVGREDRRLVR